MSIPRNAIYERLSFGHSPMLGALSFLPGKVASTQPEPPHTCKFCGMPSWVDPSDQVAPADYCQESDHGDPEA